MNKYTTSTHRNTKDETLYVAILCGGVGYRAKTKGNKILSQVGDYTVFEHQLSVIRHVYPKSTLIISIGFDADKLIRLRPENSLLIENCRYETENVAEEVRLVLNAVNPKRLLLIDGAIHFTEDGINKMTETSSVLSCHNTDPQEIGLQIEDGYATHFSYGLPDKWSGICYLESVALDNLKKVSTRQNSKFQLHELLNLVVERGCQLKVISNKSKLIKF